MRSRFWVTAGVLLVLAGQAAAEEKTEEASNSSASKAAATAAAAKSAAAAAAAKAEAAEAAAKAAAAEEAAAEAAKAEKSAKAAAAEDVAKPAASAEAETPAAPEVTVEEAPAVSSGPFETAWKDASQDEKAAFLEANPEIRVKVSEKWDKSTAKQRKAALAKSPVLAARALKHKWEDATPEEKIVFLSTLPDQRKRIKESWDLLNADQRFQVVRKHPSYTRKALHHIWKEATPEEKTAFLESQGDLKRSVGRMWAEASGSDHKAFEETTPDERVQFVERLSAVEATAGERWLTLNPGLRAQLVRRWAGWPLRPSLLGLPSGASSAKKAAPAGKKQVKGKKHHGDE